MPDEPDISDRLPSEVLDAARGAFDDRRPGELASLVSDSLLDGCGTPEDHDLRFEHQAVNIAVHVRSGPDQSQISGTVEPAGPESVSLHFHATDLAMVAPLDEGHFAFHPIGHGLVRVEVGPAGDRPAVRTDWFRI